jgi:hypothetical protein
MEQGLNLSTVALLAILVIGFYVFVIRKQPATTDGKAKRPTPPPGPAPTPNAPPLALEPFVVGNGEWGERLRIDARYRKHGCDTSGAPTDETGAYDPDNELLEFWFEADGPNKDGADVQYAVFDSLGRRIDRRWLPREYFPVYYRDRRDPTSPTEQNAVVSCFVGHTGDEPPYPMATRMGVGCNRPAPSPPPHDVGNELGTMRIVYKVRDPQGQEASAGLLATVYSGPC